MSKEIYILLQVTRSEPENVGVIGTYTDIKIAENHQKELIKRRSQYTYELHLTNTNPQLKEILKFNNFRDTIIL